jgi:hypothetical protein
MTDSLTELESLARAATPGPYTAELVDQCEPVSPNIWRVHGGDDSYEATVCECWTGEQSNGAQARYIAALSPERALKLVAIIRAADAMRIAGPTTKADRRADYDAARAAWEGK